MTDAERIEVLALAYALLDGSPWYRGVATPHTGGLPARDAHCVVTALSLALTEKYGPRAIIGAHYDQLWQVVKSGVPGGLQLSRYNDAPGRRKRDVLRIYERAAAKIGKR